MLYKDKKAGWGRRESRDYSVQEDLVHMYMERPN